MGYIVDRDTRGIKRGYHAARTGRTHVALFGGWMVTLGGIGRAATHEEIQGIVAWYRERRPGLHPCAYAEVARGKRL